MKYLVENSPGKTNPVITDSSRFNNPAFDNPDITVLLQHRECKRIRHDDDVCAGHCDSRVAASNAPRKCPGGKGWIGGGAQASSPSYRRFDARAEGEKRISLPVVVEVPVGVERECEYVRVCIAVCFCERILSTSLRRAKKICKTLRRHRDIENNDEDDEDDGRERRVIGVLTVATDLARVRREKWRERVDGSVGDRGTRRELLVHAIRMRPRSDTVTSIVYQDPRRHNFIEDSFA